LFNHFLREFIPTKEVFKFTPMFIVKYLLSYIACHDSLDPLFKNLRIWIQGSGATGHVSSVTYFSNLLEDKDRRLKIKLTLSLIL
jgi:hypothetical protein